MIRSDTLNSILHHHLSVAPAAVSNCCSSPVLDLYTVSLPPPARKNRGGMRLSNADTCQKRKAHACQEEGGDAHSHMRARRKGGTHIHTCVPEGRGGAHMPTWVPEGRGGGVHAHMYVGLCAHLIGIAQGSALRSPPLIKSGSEMLMQ
eukprot:356861-Chlamydomonas_euryale.AAC.14